MRKYMTLFIVVIVAPILIWGSIKLYQSYKWRLKVEYRNPMWPRKGRFR